MNNVNAQIYDSDSDDEEADELYLKYFSNNNHIDSKKRLSTGEYDITLDMDQIKINPRLYIHE